MLLGSVLFDRALQSASVGDKKSRSLPLERLPNEDSWFTGRVDGAGGELGLSSGNSLVGGRSCSGACSGRVLLLDQGGAFPGRRRTCSLFRVSLLVPCGVGRVGIRSGDPLFPDGPVEWLGRRRTLWCIISVLESQFTFVVVVGGEERFDSRVVRRLEYWCTMRSEWGTPIGRYNR